MYPDLPILAFFVFLAFFVLRFSLFFCAFCSLFQGFRGFGRAENPCFFRGFLAFLPKKRGKEDQGTGKQMRIPPFPLPPF